MAWLLAGRLAVLAGKGVFRLPDVFARVARIVPAGERVDAEITALRSEVRAYDVRLALLRERDEFHRELERKRDAAAARLAARCAPSR